MLNQAEKSFHNNVRTGSYDAGQQIIRAVRKIVKQITPS